MNVNGSLVRSNARIAVLAVFSAVSAAGGVEPKELPEAVQGILSRTVAAYRQLNSYRDDAVIEIRMTAADAANTHRMPMGLSFERPNKVRVDLNMLMVICDGTKLYRFLNILGKYTEEAAPANLTSAGMMGPMPSTGLGSFIHFKLLMDDDPLAEILRHAAEVSLAPEEAVDGQPCHVVAMRGQSGQFSARLLIDRRTHLVRELRLLAERQEGELPAGMPEQVSIILKNARVNEDIPDEVFSFRPPERAVRVDDLIAASKEPPVPVPPPPPEAAASAPAGPEKFAVGSPAPAFELKDLEGGSFKLADAKGKVVVLDFWATWCKPCMVEMPHLQKAWVSFKDQPVVFVGVCTDIRVPTERVRAIVKKLGVSFATLLDENEVVSRRYQVFGLPTTVLIDQEGVVRWTHTGWTDAKPNPVDVLTEEVKRLLGK